MHIPPENICKKSAKINKKNTMQITKNVLKY